MVPIRSIAGILVVLLAGCLGDGDPADGQQPSAEAVATVPVQHDADGCSMGVLVLLRDAEALAEFLPEGFVPADAQGLLGTPAPAGMGAALLTAYHCDGSEWLGGPLDAGEINILVQDPGLADGEVDDHYYLAEITTSDGPLAARLRGDGWNVVDGSSQVEMAGPAPGHLAIEVMGTGPSYSATLTGAIPNPLAGSSRFWHATPEGPSWFDYAVATDVLVGAAQAEYGQGTLASRLAAAGDPEALGIAVPSFSWQATYHPPIGAGA